MASKIIEYPQFTPPPQTDAADVNENIIGWIKRKDNEHIRKFLRKSDKPGSFKGYMFIEKEELTETKMTEQFIKFVKPKNIRGEHFEVIFIQRYDVTNRSFYPLCFSFGKLTVIVKRKYSNEMIVYESDAQLRRFIQSFNV